MSERHMPGFSRLPRWALFGVPAALLVAAIFAAFLRMTPTVQVLMVGMLLAPLAFGVFYARPALAVWLILGLFFFGNRNEIPQLAFWGRYLSTLGVGAFVGAVALRGALAGQTRWRGVPLLAIYALFGALVLISALYNRSSAEDLVLSLLTNLRYPLFFVALLQARLPGAFYDRVLAVFVALTFLQLPVMAVQFARGQVGDFLVGTLGSNEAVLATVLTSQAILFVRWLTRGRWRDLLLTAVLAFPLLIGDIQIGLAFAPALIGVIILRHYSWRRIARAVAVIAAVVVVSAGAVLAMAAVVPTVGRFLAVMGTHVEYLFNWRDPTIASFASIGRLTILPLSFPLLAEDPVRLLIGFGPEAASGGLLSGAAVGGGAGGFGGSFCQKLLLEVGALCREPQSFRSLAEFGLLGMVLYNLPLVLLWLQGGRMLRRGGLSQAQRERLLVFQGFGFFYIFLGVWYISVWRLDGFSFPFWFLAAGMFATSAPEPEAPE